MEAERLIIRSKTPEGVVSFDEYGFAVFSDDQGDIERQHNYTSVQNFTPEHVSAWQKFVDSWPDSFMASPNRLRCLLRRGLPSDLRPDLWGKLLGCEQQQKTSSFSYSECIRALRSQMVELGISEYCLRHHGHQDVWDEDEDGTAKRDQTKKHEPTQMRHLVPLQTLRQIVVDLERTFPTHRLFMGSSPEAKEGRASLFRLLSVYALYNPTVGYCQGMSYLVGMLLMVMKTEEEVFWAMVALFEKPKFLAGYFDSNLKRIQSHASLFHRLLAQRFPKVAKHFVSLGVQPLMYVTPWFMCLYTSLPCWDTVLAIWDLILLDGVTTIFRVGLSLIELHKEQIVSNTDLTKILPPLLHPLAERVSHDIVLPVVWRTNIEKWEVEALHAVIAEEEDPARSGVKRRHRAETTFGEKPQEKKRMRLSEEKPKPAATNGFFQRVINIFTPRNQRADEQAPVLSSSRSQVQNPHQAHNSRQSLHKRPGGARPARQRSGSKAKEVSRLGIDSSDTVMDFRLRRSPRNGLVTGGKGSPKKSSVKMSKTNTKAGDMKRSASPSQDEIGKGQIPSSIQMQLTPRSTGRSKLFGRLHAQIFGSEEPSETKLSHPLEDVVAMGTALPDLGKPSPKVRRRLSRDSSPTKVAQRSSPRTSSSSQRPLRRSTWLSPYCRQYMVNPASSSNQSNSTTQHITTNKNVNRSTATNQRHNAKFSTAPSLDENMDSPCIGVTRVGKENDSNVAFSPRVILPLGDGNWRELPSVGSLDNTPKVAGRLEKSWMHPEPRSPLTENHQIKGNLINNNIPTFKTPSHGMLLRSKQYTPGMYSIGRTPRSEGRQLLAGDNPMNVPSARRLVCRTAKAQHSFKIFHTPTPMRKSKVTEVNPSPNWSSPEVELTTLSLVSPSTSLGLSRMNLDD